MVVTSDVAEIVTIVKKLLLGDSETEPERTANTKTAQDESTKYFNESAAWFLK